MKEVGHWHAESTLPRDNPDSKVVCALCDNVHIGPVLETNTTHLAGLHSIEILVSSKKNLHNCSWLLISRGLKQHASHILNVEQFVAEEAERYLPQTKL